MGNSLLRLRRRSIAFLLALTLPLSLAVFAQEDESEDESDAAASEEASEEEQAQQALADLLGVTEEIVVTGSRLKRTTYDTMSPIQIITAEVSREAGLIDAADILQDAAQTSGQQIDLTYTGFVLDNGPAASTVALRGLEADRTLILINGRRLAPAGVEGAPSSPDLNLIPGSLVQQYELLLDGASSIYGSDAIAGVANVILRKDFNGLELDAFADRDEFSGKGGRTFSATWGRNFDRGFVGMGASYFTAEEVTAADSPALKGCTHDVEIDEDGNVRSKSIWFEEHYGMKWSDCGYAGLLTNWITSIPLPYFTGLFFSTPGESNGGFKNWSVSRIRLGGQWFWTDEDGDGYNDVSWEPYMRDINEQFRTVYPQFKRVNFMTYGEYTFEGDANVTPFYEFTYGKRSSSQNGGAYQLFPYLHPLNPFNPCNPYGVNGVDCGLGLDELLSKQSLRSAVFDVFGCDIGPGGSCDLTIGPIGPVPLLPVISIRGDRNITFVDVAQFRYVTGLTFDIPFLNKQSRSNWSGEISFNHTYSLGKSSREGVLEPQFELALGEYSSFGVPCQNDSGVVLDPEVTQGCVPVNLFAPSVLDPSGQGDFATQRERDYLFGERSFDTKIYQTLISAYIVGDLLPMPGGAISASIGAEWREDHIKSIPNRVASEGLFWGFSADQGAEGVKTTWETFGEIEIPVLANLPYADELTLNLSARRTDDQYYGAAWTWSAKMAYRPATPILIRATQGTSYRSPNLRNLFLKQQTGFLTLFDPCLVPTVAIDDNTGEYLPDEDRRDEEVMENCRLQGVDPTRARHPNNFNSYSVEVAQGGTLDLNPETSTSTAYGVTFEQPFTNEFQLSLGFNYYIVDVDDTIIEPSAGFIIADCYYSTTGVSPFCSRISRDSDPDHPLMSLVHQGFINRDNEKVRGMDYNVAFSDTVTFMDKPILLTVDLTTHKLLERSTLYINTALQSDQNRYAGEWGYHRYKHQLAVAAEFNQMRFVWSMTANSPQKTDDISLDSWGSVNTFQSDTCKGPPDDVLCRDIGWTSHYFHHTASFVMARDAYRVSVGVRNVFDVEPPFVDDSEVFSTSNAPYGGFGYDLTGRSAFVNFTYRLGGTL